MQRNLKCLYVKENSLPEEIMLPNNLKSKQEMVKGDIEYVYLTDDEEVVLICNEYAKSSGMGPNRDIGYDVIYGPFLIVGETTDDGEDRSLTEEQISKYKEKFNEKSIEKTYEKITKILFEKNNNIDF